MEGSERKIVCCRLCEEKSDKLISIFDKNLEGKQIIQVIKDNLPIIIYRSDPLSKVICETCLENIEKLSTFKKKCLEVDEKNKADLKMKLINGDRDVTLYMGIENPEDMKLDINSGMTDASTDTTDITMLCVGCNKELADMSAVNGELELCATLKKDLFNDCETDKNLRSRRKKSQPFYHELDESICSSVSELTQHTESSQPAFEFHSDQDSLDSDLSQPRKKRRIEIDEENNGVDAKLTETDMEVDETAPAASPPEENGPAVNGNSPLDDIADDDDDEPDDTEVENNIRKEVEYRYNPLSLTQLVLNCINKTALPSHVPARFTRIVFSAQCKYCLQKFENTKHLAMHEIVHMDVELTEKIDHPARWPSSREYASVRNKWLSFFDEHGYDEDDLVVNSPLDGDSLLIPIDMDKQFEEMYHNTKSVVTLDGPHAVVNGRLLSDYPKEERRKFYHPIFVGGLKKRICHLCRYVFKDNWALESHYFSSACYYTCRYCGTRFNKQRQRFDDHIREHVQNGDQFNTNRMYTPSKVNNYLPKVINDKIKQAVAGAPKTNDVARMEVNNKLKTLLTNKNPASSPRPNYQMPFAQPEVQIKNEPKVNINTVTSQSKSTNQAYFCRKCYKIFFKLEEFNVHSKQCDFNNQFPSFIKHSPHSSSPLPLANNPKPSSTNSPRNGDIKTQPSPNRPSRNCTKDQGPYRDEVYIPEALLRETVQPNQPKQPNPHNQGPPFVCVVCNTAFPTVYSRNSHMRIHKGDTNTPPAKPKVPGNHFMSQDPPQMYPYTQQITNEPVIKQEPLEPEVQIHETNQMINSAAVSITPIPKKNSAVKTVINPNIYKLVEGNPNISLQKRSPEKITMPQIISAGSLHPSSIPDADKSYKCSNCWEAFGNKSHLYFHKKNQCEGSRFPCPFCKKRFGTEAAYSSHIFYSHPE